MNTALDNDYGFNSETSDWEIDLTLWAHRLTKPGLKAAIGSATHLLYCFTNADTEALYKGVDGLYHVNLDKLRTLDNPIVRQVSVTRMRNYLAKYWEGSALHKMTIRRILNKFSDLKCFNTESDFAKRVRQPTIFKNISIGLLLKVHAVLEKVWHKRGNTTNELPQHKGYIAHLLYTAWFKVKPNRNKGFGQLKDEEKQSLLNDGQIPAAPTNKKAPSPKTVLTDVYESTKDIIFSQFGFFRTEYKKKSEYRQKLDYISIDTSKPLPKRRYNKPEDMRQFSSLYCEPPGLDDYLVELPY